MTRIYCVFPNFSSHVQDFRLDRKLGMSFLYDKLNFMGFFRDVVALFTQVFAYLNPKRFYETKCLWLSFSDIRTPRQTNV